jgi:hypothetical protein
MSFFRAAKNTSTTALSQHTPIRPRLATTRWAAQNFATSADL